MVKVSSFQMIVSGRSMALALENLETKTMVTELVL